MQTGTRRVRSAVLVRESDFGVDGSVRRPPGRAQALEGRTVGVPRSASRAYSSSTAYVAPAGGGGDTGRGPRTPSAPARSARVEVRAARGVGVQRVPVGRVLVACSSPRTEVNAPGRPPRPRPHSELELTCRRAPAGRAARPGSVPRRARTPAAPPACSTSSTKAVPGSSTATASPPTAWSASQGAYGGTASPVKQHASRPATPSRPRAADDRSPRARQRRGVRRADGSASQ